MSILPPYRCCTVRLLPRCWILSTLDTLSPNSPASSQAVASVPIWLRLLLLGPKVARASKRLRGHIYLEALCPLCPWSVLSLSLYLSRNPLPSGVCLFGSVLPCLKLPISFVFLPTRISRRRQTVHIYGIAIYIPRPVRIPYPTHIRRDLSCAHL
ncbi:hypothetical protein K438DRAFT_553825 [Mycena galopus ATCC 62051]|nr:hypothetical protein K438DRAFT_553825 [Mycena galopus ATCC 62051]